MPDLSRLKQLAAERASFRRALRAVTETLAAECRAQYALGAKKADIARAAGGISRMTLDEWLRQRTEER